MFERDDFYELADERGVMLWEEAKFACSLYPRDRAFLDSVEVEARDQVGNDRQSRSFLEAISNTNLWCDCAHKPNRDRAPLTPRSSACPTTRPSSSTAATTRTRRRRRS